MRIERRFKIHTRSREGDALSTVGLCANLVNLEPNGSAAIPRGDVIVGCLGHVNVDDLWTLSRL